MAIFNPDAGGVPSANMPDQTGASRGSTPNRSLEVLFSGAGDMLSGAVKAIDTGIKYGIEQDVRSGFDQAMKPYGDTIPSELKQSGSAMRTLQSAYDQGKISDVYYTGQLASLNKSLRAKYPGYENYVDDMVQSVTGIRPANSYRNAVMAEFEAAQRDRLDGEKTWDTWVKQNEEYVYQVAPDYFNNPEKYDRDELRTAVVKKKSDVTTLEDENTRMSYLFNQDKLSQAQAEESATLIFGGMVSSSMEANSNVSFGFSPQGFLKQIEQMSSEGPNPEELAQLTAQFGQAKGQMRLALEQKANQVDQYGNSIYKMVGATETKALIEAAMSQYDAIEQMITNKDFGLASYYTRLNALQGDKELNRVLNASPELRTANALATIDRSLATLYIQEGGKQEGIFAQIAPELAARVATGDDTLNNVVDRIVTGTGTGQEKAGGINATLNSLLGTIKSGNATPEQIANSASSLYTLSQEGTDDLWTYVNPDERFQLYAKMYNPEVTKALIASGDKDTLNTYYESARDRIFAIPQLRKAAAALNDTNFNWQEHFEVQYNQGTGRLDLNVKKGGVDLMEDGLLGAALYTFDKKKAEDAINTLNYAFDNLGNIAEGLGVDDGMKGALYGQVLKELNVELEQGEKTGFFDWLGKSVGDFFTTDESEAMDLYNDIRQNDVELNLLDEEYEMGSTGDVITDTIIGFEGYRDNAYWDVNANRAGYGSDTITRPDGTVEAVTKDTVTTREDAARDLNRRLTTEFIPEIIDDIGMDRWRELTPNQQAALSSIAYNYGSLPSKVVKAVKKGDIVGLAKAISAMESHNGGINRKRRRAEGKMFIADSHGQDIWKGFKEDEVIGLGTSYREDIVGEKTR